MNALYVLSLVVAVANAHYYNGLLPYSHNLLHTNAFRSVASPLQYTVAAPAPFRYNVAAAAPTSVKYTVAAAPAPLTFAAPSPVASVKYTVAAAPAPLTFAAPSPVAYTTAAVAPAVIAPITRTSQYHAQDEFGQYSFGYSGGPSSRNEVRDAFGVVRGSYNQVDANGEIQTTNYVADALGFRVASTNLPVAPKAVDAPVVASLEPVMDTAEVKAAKAVFKIAFDEATAAAPASRKKRSVGSVAIHSAVSPLNFAYGFNAVQPYNFPAVAPAVRYAAAPVVTYSAGHAVAPAAAVRYAAAPAVTYAAGHAVAPAAVTYNAAAPAIAATHDATLLRVENNPGHAVSYRVY